MGYVQELTQIEHPIEEASALLCLKLMEEKKWE